MEQHDEQDNKEIKQKGIIYEKKNKASTKGPSNGFCFIRIEKSQTDMVSIFFPRLRQQEQR